MSKIIFISAVLLLSCQESKYQKSIEEGEQRTQQLKDSLLNSEKMISDSIEKSH